MVIHITKCVDFIFVRIGLQTQVVSMKDSAIQCTLLQAPPLSWNSITDTEEQELSDGMESDTGPETTVVWRIQAIWKGIALIEGLEQRWYRGKNKSSLILRKLFIIN